MTQHVELETIRLDEGAHRNPETGMCLLEAVAFFAGEKFSDHPDCVSPILGAYGRTFNDRLDEANRQRLVAYIPRLVGTAGDGRDEQRGIILRTWILRDAGPRWLERAGLHAEAEQMRAIDPTSRQSVIDAWETLRRIRDRAWEARREAIRRLREALKPTATATATAAATADATATATATATAAAATAAAATAAAAAAATAAAAAAADADAAAAAAAAAAADADAAAATAAAAAATAAAADADATAATATELIPELRTAISSVKINSSDSYDTKWNKYYAAARPIFDRFYKNLFADIRSEYIEEGFTLFDRLIAATAVAEAA